MLLLLLKLLLCLDTIGSKVGKVDAIESMDDAHSAEMQTKVGAIESKVDAIEGMLSSLIESRVGLGQVDCITEGRIVRFTCKNNTICY